MRLNIDRLAGDDRTDRYAARRLIAREALMRHFLAPRAIPALPLGVATRSTQRLLIASPGAAHALAPSKLGTLPGAVDVAVIAGRADRHLHPAAAAVIEPIGRLLREPQQPLPDGTGQHQGREA